MSAKADADMREVAAGALSVARNLAVRLAELESTAGETIKELQMEVECLTKDNESLRQAYAHQSVRLNKPPAASCNECPLLPFRPPLWEEPQ